MVAEVERNRSGAQLDDILSEHGIRVQGRRRRCQRERGNDHAAGVEQHGDITGDAGAVGRDIGKAGLRRLAKNLLGPQDARRRRDEIIAARPRRPLVGRIVGIEQGDGADHGSGRVQCVGEFAVGFRIAGIEQEHVDADHLGIEFRETPHDPREHVAGQRKRPRLPDRILVDGGDHDAARRHPRSGEGIAPVEREIFELVKPRSERREMPHAEEAAPGGTEHHEQKGERGPRRGSTDCDH